MIAFKGPIFSLLSRISSQVVDLQNILNLKVFLIITDEIRLIRSGDEEVKQRRLQTQGKDFDLQNFHRYDEVSV